jgi:sarcosine oxidase delta subunit
MEFKIKCPHCGKEITKKDFEQDEQSLLALQKYFESWNGKGFLDKFYVE